MKLLVGLAAVATAALILAPSAQADAQDFLDDLYDNGWYSHGGDTRLLTNGYRVCSMLNRTTGDVVAEYVYENTGANVTRTDAMEFVIFAVEDLCPQHDHRTSAGV